MLTCFRIGEVDGTAPSNGTHQPAAHIPQLSAHSSIHKCVLPEQQKLFHQLHHTFSCFSSLQRRTYFAESRQRLCGIACTSSPSFTTAAHSSKHLSAVLSRTRLRCGRRRQRLLWKTGDSATCRLPLSPCLCPLLCLALSLEPFRASSCALRKWLASPANTCRLKPPLLRPQAAAAQHARNPLQATFALSLTAPHSLSTASDSLKELQSEGHSVLLQRHGGAQH